VIPFAITPHHCLNPFFKGIRAHEQWGPGRRKALLTTLDETRQVGFLEAVFALEIDDRQWLEHVLSALGALCGAENQYRGFFYDASEIARLKLWNVCVPGNSAELEPAFALFQGCATPELVTKAFRSLPISSLRRHALPHMAPVLAELEKSGWGDVFVINGLDPSGLGCMLLVTCKAREFSPSSAELAVFRRLAANLASAFRCRRRLSSLSPAAPNQASDRAHAPASEPPLANVIDLARAQLRTLPPVADTRKTKRDNSRSTLNFSHPSSRARLTLVHTFEESGRRYIVARENDAATQGIAALTEREREIVEHATHGFTNKQIAYNLGISNATVRVLMARAANRIGVRTRRELLAHPALQEMQVRPLANQA
jgi:DNA-binding NarL/FixJ family response regulator